MGSMVLYIIEWAFALLVLMAIYKAAFSGTTLHRFNRFYLLGATLLSALLPLMKVTVTEGTSVTAGLSIEETDFARELSGTLTFAGEPGIIQADETETAQTPQSGKRTSLWAVMLIGTYTIYVLTLIIGWSRSIVRTCKFLHGKPRRRLSRTVWLVTHSEPYGPFSWMNYIVISDSEKGFARHASLRHEYSHVKLFHSIDLVVLLACTIVNPVCWLVLQEIKIVHEYEADDEVINRYGIQEEYYQRLLILRTVGAEAYALASSFNLNIKKRIIMMNKYKTRKRRLIWLLLLVPMLGMTFILFARTEKAIGPDDVLNLTSSTRNDDVESLLNSTTVRISGRVIDQQGNPVESVSFYLMADAPSSSQTVLMPSGKNGEFSLSAKKGEVLIVAKDGYNPIKIAIEKPLSDLTITLEKPVISAVDEKDKDEVYMVVDQQPEFPGGAASMMQYLARNMRYPQKAHDDSIQGIVRVSFIIGKDGSINDAEVVQSVHPLLDAEALRVIREMPKWDPGYQNGEPVKVKYTVPINFRLSTATAPAAQWIVLYDAKKESDEMDQNVLSFFMSSMSASNIDLKKAGIQETPQVKTLLESLKSAQSEAEKMQQSFTEQMNKGTVELDKLAADIERERRSLSESEQASRDQELMDLNAKIRGQYQELKRKMNDWMDETENKLQPQFEAAWQSISKNGAYICHSLIANPVNDVIVTPDNLESALKEFFEGRRGAVALPFSEDNYQQIRSLLSGKYANKPVFYIDRR